MGLIKETNAQYYSGQQSFVADGSSTDYQCTFDTNLIDTIFGVSNTNFSITINNSSVGEQDYQLIYPNIIRFTNPPSQDSIIVVKLNRPSIENNYGGYEYISLIDIVNNFMFAYVGVDKIIPRVKRSDVVWHAKRGLQEFSYDTLKSITDTSRTPLEYY